MSLKIVPIGDAVVITFDRPETRNAIDRKLARQLGEAVRLASEDLQVRGIVITGEGKIFLSGGDLKEIAELAKTEDGGSELLAMLDALGSIEECDLPVVAAVQGDVYGGGCEFILLCDMVVMEEQAQLSFRHAKMGLVPAWGGTTRLVERVGPLEAARLLFTADKISATEALRIGLVNEVVPRGAARSRALSLVARISDNPRTAVAALKRALGEVRKARRADAIVREREVFAERWGNPDHQAAMNAFLSRPSVMPPKDKG